MTNYIPSIKIKKVRKIPKTYTYYPEFIQKNNNLTQNVKGYDESYNEFVSISQRPINKRNKENYFDNNNLIYIEEPYSNNYGIDNKYNLFQSNNIFDENDYDEKILIKKKKYNTIRNINLKNYNSFHTKNNDIFDEYIIDYKAGLNRDNNKTNKNLSINDDIYFQKLKNKSIINNTNKTYNKSIIMTNELNKKNNNLKEINQYNSKIYKNFTCNYFYNMKDSKDKIRKKYLDAPYKKRIINNYTYNEFKENMKNINNFCDNLYSKNKNKFLINNTINNNIKSNIKIKNNFKKIHDYKNNLNLNNINRNEIKYKKVDKKVIGKRASYSFSNNKKSKTIPLINIKNFICHFSKYCILYYFKIIKQFFSSLKRNNNFKSIKSKIYDSYKISTTISTKKIPVPPQDKIISSFNRNSIVKSDVNKSNSSNTNTKNILIDRIRSRNESQSPNNKDGPCEMYRNISELTKKFEIINNRKNRQSHNSLKRIIKDISFNNDHNPINEFRFSSVERNKEKMEIAINKERERKKRLSQKKIKKENTNRENKNQSKDISMLIEKSNILKNKIKNLEENELKSNKLNWDLDSITINSKINKKIRQNKHSYEKRKIPLLYENEKNNRNIGNSEIIKVKKIQTKDKSIQIDLSFLNYIPIKKNNKKTSEKNKLYKICNHFNIIFIGNIIKRKLDEKNETDKIKYHNELTSIMEEENKIDFSDNISKNSYDIQ